jgi:shikimate kinase
VLNARHRPLIEAESPEARRERIRNLLAERAPLYAAIPIQVKTSREPVKKVVRKVLSAVTEPIPSKTDNTLE